MQGSEREQRASGVSSEGQGAAGERTARPPFFDTREMYSMGHNPYLRFAKPFLDVVLGSIALIIVSPVLLVIALAIKIRMGSPVILRQARTGRYGTTFGLYKFRTMEPNRRINQAGFIGEDRRRVHKSANDPRITGLGRWLRASRLDELPQLLNVVRGELSLVGPRPEMVEVVAEYEPWQHRRHAVKPGLTGLWQISDTGEKLLLECTEMELEYLDIVSLRTDFAIILKTLPAMVRKTGI